MLSTQASSRLVALLRLPETREAVARVLAGIPEVQADLRVGRLADTDIRRLGRGGLLLVDVDLRDEGDRLALQKVVGPEGWPGPVLVTTPEPTLEELRWLMRLGITDAIPQPVQPADLSAALRSARQRLSAMPSTGNARRGKILPFLKSGGGSGATTIAVNLACELAKKCGPGRVALLDLDLQFGDASLFLDMEGGHSAIDLAEVPERIDGALLRGIMATHASGLDVLPAPPVMPPLEILGPDLVARVLDIAAEEYDYVLIDLPHCWNAWVRAVLGGASGIALVSQATLPALRQARRQLDTLREEGLGDIPVVPILNRFDGKGFFGKGRALREVERTLGLEVIHFVPDGAEKVQQAVDAGLPLREYGQTARLGKRVVAIAKSLLAAEASSLAPAR